MEGIVYACYSHILIVFDSELDSAKVTTPPAAPQTSPIVAASTTTAAANASDSNTLSAANATGKRKANTENAPQLSEAPPTAPSKANKGARISMVTGDLFEAKTNLGHCISADARLGKGIAKLFRAKFGGDSFVARIKELNKGVGDCAAVLAGDRYVYNLVTKNLYHEKPTYDTLRASLRAMRAHMESNGVKSVALPHGFGCGLDGLSWPAVLRILEEEFDDSAIAVSIHKLGAGAQ